MSFMAHHVIRGRPLYYLGDVTVAFKPRDVQAYLRAAGLNMITSQSGERIVLPYYSGAGIDPESVLYKNWLSGKYMHSLTPIKAVTADKLYGSGVSLVSGNALMNGSESALRNLNGNV